MDAKSVFAACVVRLMKDSIDLGKWTVVGVEHACLTVESQAPAGPIPAVDEMLTAHAVHHNTLFHIPVRVTAARSGERLSLTLEQQGEITQTERRERNREIVQWPVTVHREKTGETLTFSTEDVNSRGMKIRVGKAFESGEPLRVELDVRDGGQAIVLVAQVAHCAAKDAGYYDVGIRFSGASEAQRERIVEALLREIFWRGGAPQR